MQPNVSPFAIRRLNEPTFESPDASSNAHRRAGSADRFKGQSNPIPFPDLNKLTLLHSQSPDPKPTYAISYVPGVCEHKIETGETLPESQMKVVLLHCELERVNSVNYRLVKENEVLRSHHVRSERERDLENKLAIVLAENDKLIHVVEEIHQVYQASLAQGSLANIPSDQQHQAKIDELISELGIWKKKAESQTIDNAKYNLVELQASIAALEADKQSLNDAIARRDADIGMLKTELVISNKAQSQFQAQNQGQGQGLKELLERNSGLISENGRLLREIEQIKAKNISLQGKLQNYEKQMRLLMEEHEKLMGVVNERFGDVKPLLPTKSYLSPSKTINDGVRLTENLEFDAHSDYELVKRAASRVRDNEQERVNEVIESLIKENKRLVEGLQNQSPTKNQIQDNQRIKAQVEALVAENGRLNALVADKVHELEQIKRHLREVQEGGEARGRARSLMPNLSVSPVKSSAPGHENSPWQDRGGATRYASEETRGIVSAEGPIKRSGFADVPASGGRLLSRPESAGLSTSFNVGTAGVDEAMQNAKLLHEEVKRLGELLEERDQQIRGLNSLIISRSPMKGSGRSEQARDIINLNYGSPAVLESVKASAPEVRQLIENKIKEVESLRNTLEIKERLIGSYEESLSRADQPQFKQGSPIIGGSKAQIEVADKDKEIKLLNDLLVNKSLECDRFREEAKALPKALEELHHLKNIVGVRTDPSGKISVGMSIGMTAEQADVSGADKIKESYELNNGTFAERPAEYYSRDGGEYNRDFESPDRQNVKKSRNLMSSFEAVRDANNAPANVQVQPRGEVQIVAGKPIEVPAEVKAISPEKKPAQKDGSESKEKLGSLKKMGKRYYRSLKDVRTQPVEGHIQEGKVELSTIAQDSQVPEETKVKWLKILEQENKRLHELEDLKHAEIRNLNRKIQETNPSNTEEIESLKSEAQQLKEEKDKLVAMVEEKEQSIQALVKDIDIKTTTIESFVPITMGEEETRKEIEVLASENLDLRATLDDKYDELRKLQIKVAEVAALEGNENLRKHFEKEIAASKAEEQRVVETKSRIGDTTGISTPRTYTQGGKLDSARIGAAGHAEAAQQSASGSPGKALVGGEFKRVTFGPQGEVVENVDLALLVDENDTNVESLHSKLRLFRQENNRLGQMIEDKSAEIKTIKVDMENQKALVATLRKSGANATENENLRLREALHEKESTLQVLSSQLYEISEAVFGPQAQTVEGGQAIASHQGSIHTSQAMQQAEDSTAANPEERRAIQNKLEVLKKVLEAKGITRESVALMQITDTEVKKKIQSYEDENRKLNSVLDAKDKELQRLNTKFLEGKILSDASGMTPRQAEILKRSQDPEKLAQQLIEQEEAVRNLTEAIAVRDMELQRFKSSVSAVVQGQVDDSIISENAELKKMLKAKTTEIEELNEELETKDRLCEGIRDFESGIEQVEGMVENLVNENERIRGLLDAKIIEVKELKETKVRMSRKQTGTSHISEVSEENLASQLHQGDFNTPSRLDKELDAVKSSKTHSRNQSGGPEDSKKWTETIQKLEFLTEENERLTQALQEKQQEADQLKSELGLAQSREAELKKKLVEEMEKLMNRFITEKTKIEEHLSSWVEKAQSLETDNKNLIQEIENVRRTERERAEERLDEEIKNQMNRLVIEKKEADDKINRLNAEIARVQGYLNRTLMELQEEKKRFSELEVQRAKEMDRLRQQFEHYDRSEVLDDESKNVPEVVEAERIAYEIQINQLQTNVSDLERELESLNRENKELRRIGAQRLRELEEFKRRVKDMDEQHRIEVDEVKRELSSKLSKQSSESDLLAKVGPADKGDLKTLQQINRKYKEQIEKLQQMAKQQKDGLQEINHQYNTLKNMYDTVKKEATEKNNESAQRIEKLDLLQRENAQLEKAKQEYMMRAERNNNELTKKNIELMQSIQELEAARIKYEEAVSTYGSRVPSVQHLDQRQ